MGILIIILGSLLITLVIDMEWEESLPFMVMAILLCTYTLGIVGRLQYLYWLKIVLLIFILAGNIYFICRNKTNIFILIKNKSTPGIILFFLVCIIVGGVLSTHKVIEWDDLSHWATIAKQMFYLKQIPTAANSLSSYTDYQPLGALGFYWFLSDFKVYHEALLFPVNYFLISICFLPFWKQINIKNRGIVRGGACIICILLPWVISFSALLCLKIDSFAAALFVFACIQVWNIGINMHEVVGGKEILRKENIIFLISMGTLVLTKSIGMYLCIFLILSLLVLSIVNRKGNYILLDLMALLIVGAFNMSWKVFCQMHGNNSYISAGFSQIMVTDYIQTVKGMMENIPIFLFIVILYLAALLLYCLIRRKEKISLIEQKVIIFALLGINLFISYQSRFGCLKAWFEQFVDDGSTNYIVSHYYYALSTWPCTLIYNMKTRYGMSLLECVLLIFLITVILKYILSNDRYYKIYCPLFLTLLFGMMVYVIGHLTMYTTMFSAPESSVLSAFSRYLMMYASGIFIIPIYVLYTYCLNHQGKIFSKGGVYLLLIGVCLMCDLTQVYTLLFQYNKEDCEQASFLKKRLDVDKLGERINEEIPDEERFVWISDPSDSRTRIALRYVLAQRGTNVNYIFWSGSDYLESLLDTEDYKYIVIQQECMKSDEIRKNMDFFAHQKNLMQIDNDAFRLYYVMSNSM